MYVPALLSRCLQHSRQGPRGKAPRSSLHMALNSYRIPHVLPRVQTSAASLIASAPDANLPRKGSCPRSLIALATL